MPRQRKPIGYEKWTWAEINAGRKFSKAEKRWNRMAKNLNWEKRQDGTYQAPAEAAPILLIMMILMFGLMIVAPLGLANASGDAAAIGTLIFFGIALTGILLIFAGHNEPGTSKNSLRENANPSSSISDQQSTPANIQPGVTINLDNPISNPVQVDSESTNQKFFNILAKCWRAQVSVLSFRWVSYLPEWIQPIFWGLLIVAPFAIGLIFILSNNSK